MKTSVPEGEETTAGEPWIGLTREPALGNGHISVTYAPPHLSPYVCGISNTA